MGLLDSLFGNDLSTNWQDQTSQPLCLNLDDSSLNGVAIGNPSSKLSIFGRPSNNRPFKDLRFTYQILGIEIEIENDLISYFGFPLNRQSNDATGPCEFTLVFPDGHSCFVDDKTQAQALLDSLSTPFESDVDENEAVYSVSINGNILELEASKDGLLKRLNIFPKV